MRRKAILMVTLLLAFGLVACGGGSGQQGVEPTTDLSAAQEAQVASVLSSMADLSIFPSAPTAPPVTVKEAGGEDLRSVCVSGSISLSDAVGGGGETTRELTFGNCAIIAGESGVSLTLNGTLTVVETGAEGSADRRESRTFNNLTITDSEGSFTLTTGTVEETATGVTFADFTAAFADASYTLNGGFTTNSDGTFNGSLTISGSATASCTFTDFNPATATDEEYAAACGS